MVDAGILAAAAAAEASEIQVGGLLAAEQNPPIGGILYSPADPLFVYDRTFRKTTYTAGRLTTDEWYAFDDGALAVPRYRGLASRDTYTWVSNKLTMKVEQTFWSDESVLSERTIEYFTENNITIEKVR